jgi:hypothetical protein
MIITISGQYGSGGIKIGNRISEVMGYKLYDSKLIVRAREIYTEISKSKDRPDWWPKRNLMPFHESNDYPSIGAFGSALWQAERYLRNEEVTYGSSFQYGKDTDSVRKAVYECQAKAVEELSAGGDCVLFGKCADYVLRGRGDVIRAFSSADMELRIDRILNLYNLNIGKISGGSRWLPPSYTLQEAGRVLDMERRDAISLIYETDKRRADLYDFLTGEKWGDPKNYDYQIDGNVEDLNIEADKFIEFISERI